MAARLPEPDGPRKTDIVALVASAQTGDPAAYDSLVRRYYGMVRLELASFTLRAGDHDELIQEGLIGLYRAVRDFRAGCSDDFRSYARSRVLQQLADHTGTG